MPTNVTTIARMPSSVDPRIRGPFNQLAEMVSSLTRQEQLFRVGPNEWSIGGAGTETDFLFSRVYFPHELTEEYASTVEQNQFLVGQVIHTGRDAGVGLQIRQNTGSQSGNMWEATDLTGGTVLAFVNASGGIGLSSNSVMIQNRAFSWNSTLTFNSACAFTGTTSDIVDFACRGVTITQASSAAACLDMRPFFSSAGTTFVYPAIRSHPQIVGTPAAGFGQRWSFAAQSSTTNDRDVAAIQGRWAVATDASRAGFLALTVFSTTTEQEGVRITAASGGCVVTIGNDSTFDGLVVNESGEDADTRIEGDTATQLFVCDAGLDAVQIGTTSAGNIADFRSSAVVINEDGSNRDFRVEGDTDTDLLFTDASADRVGVSTNAPGSTLDVAGSFQCDSVTNDTGLAHEGGFGSSTSNETNLDSVSMTQGQYLRVGNTVTMSGRFGANPTAAGAVSFEFTLPVPTTFTQDDQLAGVAFSGDVAGLGAEIIATGNNTAEVSWIAVDTSERTFSYVLTYRVI